MVFQTRLAKFLEELNENQTELKQFHEDRRSNEDTAQCQNEAYILEISERVMSNGNSLYEESLANGSDNGALTTHRSRSIQDWVESSSRSSVVTSVSPSIFSSYGGVHISRTETTASVSTERPSHHGLRNPGITTIERRYTDNHDNYNEEPAKQLVSDGFSFFEMKDYPKARSMLDAAMAVIAQLPANKQETFRLYDLRYMLSICVFYTEDPTTAEAELSRTVQEGKDTCEPDYDRQVRICHASHLLALTYIRLGHLNLARKYCQASYVGGSAISGRMNPFYDTSLALMDRILQLQTGSSSKIYTKMIQDEEQRNSLTKLFEGLNLYEPAESRFIADTPRVPHSREEHMQSPHDQGRSIFRTSQNMQPGRESSASEVIANNADSSAHTRCELESGLIPVETQSPTSERLETSFQDVDLAHLAQRVGPSKLGQPDSQTRKKFMDILRIEASKDLSRALLLGDTDKAIQILQGNIPKRSKTFFRSSATFQKQDLYLAALFGEDKVIDFLISLLGQKGRVARNDGLTALHCAALGDNYKVAEKLLDAGYPPDGRSEYYGTPLCIAVLGERLEIVGLLLQNRVSLSAECGFLGSVTHAACVTGNFPLLQALMRVEDRLDISAKAHPVRIRTLRASMVPGSVPKRWKEAKLVDTTIVDSTLEWIESQPLALAAYMGSEEMIENLLAQENVKVNARCTVMSDYFDSTRCGSEYHTALTLASMAGSKSILRLLLDHGANVVSRNPDLADLHSKQEHSDALMLAVINLQEDSALLVLHHMLQLNAPILPGVTRAAEKWQMRRLLDAIRARSVSESCS